MRKSTKGEKEEQELGKWIGKSETQLTSSLGKPDRIDFEKTGHRNYVYLSKKLKIKCERKFEINRNNMVLGLSSKNCFKHANFRIQKSTHRVLYQGNKKTRPIIDWCGARKIFIFW